ncbi:hypothetical protein TH606_06300 [Thermodesulfatator autotrophicus]|uniref:Uncharacterized protein n=1 Tax=Thermodesulfatator autotrophicus TaxID=1795632 RepID=A0A177E8M8_9BACT|nr:hypothetical protein TH606_06300 [Thermodesulfatator autotrophicus]
MTQKKKEQPRNDGERIRNEREEHCNGKEGAYCGKERPYNGRSKIIICFGHTLIKIRSGIIKWACNVVKSKSYFFHKKKFYAINESYASKILWISRV